MGQGDAIFIETPGGRQVLIDGGPSPSAVLSQLGQRMPFWDRTLDLVVLTHPDDDHITGLVEVLERYEVDAVLFREVSCEQPACQRWREILADEAITMHRAETGVTVGLDDGLRMDVLHPGVDLLEGEGFNNHSVVTRLSYGQVSFLLTGDIEAAAERRLLAQDLDLASTMLKVAHHGGCGSTTPTFLKTVNPQVAAISVGADNDFGHPCDEVLERLTVALGEGTGDAVLLRTDQHGTVELTTDGARLWVNTERGQ